MAKKKKKITLISDFTSVINLNKIIIGYNIHPTRSFFVNHVLISRLFERGVHQGRKCLSAPANIRACSVGLARPSVTKYQVLNLPFPLSPPLITVQPQYRRVISSPETTMTQCVNPESGTS